MGNLETVHTFVKGLSRLVMEDVFKPPHVTGYQDIKQKAIECIWSRVLLEQIIRG
jgi:hypothetical protein